MSMTSLSVTAGIAAVSTRLTDAAAIAKAALVCAESGSEHEAVRILLDLDELLGEATTLHGAICLLGRLQRREDEGRAPDD